MLNSIKDIEKYAFLNKKIQKFLKVILSGTSTHVLPE